MEPGGSMSHSQVLPISPSWAESTQLFVLLPIYLRSIIILSSHLRLSLPKGFFPVGLPVKILKALLPSSNLATWPAHLNLLDLIYKNNEIESLIVTVFLAKLEVVYCVLMSEVPKNTYIWPLWKYKRIHGCNFNRWVDKSGRRMVRWLSAWTSD